ncbi:MAG: DUF6884 domain-containing protein [Crocinitomicaceae bacterium]
MERIALVACVKEKLDHSARAADIYTGDSFKIWLNDAKDRDVDHIYILSGKYGLLDLNEIIEPYDLNLGNQDNSYIKKWNQGVISKLSTKHNLGATHAIIYTNKVYYEGLLDHFKSYEIPFLID